MATFVPSSGDILGSYPNDKDSCAEILGGQSLRETKDQCTIPNKRLGSCRFQIQANVVYNHI